MNLDDEYKEQTRDAYYDDLVETIKAAFSWQGDYKTISLGTDMPKDNAKTIVKEIHKRIPLEKYQAKYCRVLFCGKRLDEIIIKIKGGYVIKLYVPSGDVY